MIRVRNLAHDHGGSEGLAALVAPLELVLVGSLDAVLLASYDKKESSFISRLIFGHISIWVHPLCRLVLPGANWCILVARICRGPTKISLVRFILCISMYI